MSEEKDVKPAEGTAVESSPTEQPAVEEPIVSEDEKTQAETTSEDEKGTEPMIPKKRFDEVNTKMKTYEELLKVQDGEETPKVTKTEEEVVPEEVTPLDDETRMRQIAKQEMASKDKQIASAMELNNVMTANPDFMNHKDQVKAIIKENPSYKWQDALDLARVRSGSTPTQSPQKVAEKVAATAEGSQSSPKSEDAGKIDPMAKGPDGKYLYSQKEIEQILPKE